MNLKELSEKSDEILDVTFPIAFLILLSLGILFIAVVVIAGIIAIATGGLTACEAPQ